MKLNKLSLLMGAVLVSNTAIADLTTGLMAYYPFDGNANDASGNGNNGILNGGVTLTADHNGKANSAYLFNGIDGYISTPDAPSLHPIDQMTISAWVRNDGIPTRWSLIIEKGNAGKGIDGSGCYANSEYGLYFNSNKTFDVESAGDFNCFTSLSGKPVSLGKWHLITAVIDRKTKHLMQIYADGVLQAKQTDNYSSFNTGSEELRIGFTSDLHPVSGYFNGAIDDIRLYNRALSTVEIQQLYRINQQVNGSTGGYTSLNVTCANTTTGKNVKFISTNATSSSWNCEQKGLVVNPGDQVDITLSGKAHQ